jgi:hypothetical protein
MFGLTDKRLEEAKPILEKYRDELFRSRSFNSRSLEDELRKLWKIGYQALKEPMCELVEKKDRYREVAAYYMEQPTGPGVVEEFKQTLADLYGIRVYNDPTREQMREKYWARTFANVAA